MSCSNISTVSVLSEPLAIIGLTATSMFRDQSLPFLAGQTTQRALSQLTPH